jgi:hypothetical protein
VPQPRWIRGLATLALLPVDVLLLFIGIGSVPTGSHPSLLPRWSSRPANALRAMRLFLCILVPAQLSMLEGWILHHHLAASSSSVKMLRLLLLVLVVSHVGACTWSYAGWQPVRRALDDLTLADLLPPLTAAPTAADTASAAATSTVASAAASATAAVTETSHLPTIEFMSWLAWDELVGKAAGAGQPPSNGSLCPDLGPWSALQLMPDGDTVSHGTAWMTWIRSFYFNLATMVVVVSGDVTPTNL